MIPLRDLRETSFYLVHAKAHNEPFCPAEPPAPGASSFCNSLRRLRPNGPCMEPSSAPNNKWPESTPGLSKKPYLPGGRSRTCQPCTSGCRLEPPEAAPSAGCPFGSPRGRSRRRSARRLRSAPRNRPEGPANSNRGIPRNRKMPPPAIAASPTRSARPSLRRPYTNPALPPQPRFPPEAPPEPTTLGRAEACMRRPRSSAFASNARPRRRRFLAAGPPGPPSLRRFDEQTGPTTQARLSCRRARGGRVRRVRHPRSFPFFLCSSNRSNSKCTYCKALRPAPRWPQSPRHCSRTAIAKPV